MLPRFETTGVFPSIIVSLLALVALWAVRMTGGASSNFVALLYLPVVLSVLACRFYCTVGLGLSIAFFTPFVMHPAALRIDGADVMRGFIMMSVAVIGAVYARETRRERNGIRKLVHEQDALLATTQIVNASRRLEDAVNAILLLVPRLFPKADCSAIFFLNDNQRSLEPFDACGPGKEYLNLTSLTLDEAGIRSRGGQGTAASDHTNKGLQFPAMSALNPRARSAMAVALELPDASRPPVGMLYISSEHSHAFGGDQPSLLKEFGDRIAGPLEQLRVQEGLAGLAFTDGLTGLYNFRYFSEQLEEEVRRSMRYSRPLSLLLMDLDNFKSVNDRFGHPAGDRLLAGAAGIIRNIVRETDYPARYGGEEFAVICPETCSEDAEILGERIRAAMQRAAFGPVEGGDLKATFSIGVSSCPADGLSVSELVVGADAALYDAKRTGKNRVVVSSSSAI